MSKWDEYRVHRENMIAVLIKMKRQKNACKIWIIINALQSRLSAIEAKLKEYREF